MRIHLPLSSLLLMLPLLAGADEVYRYVDADGVVTYTEQLPYGVKGERIQTKTGPSSQTVASVATSEQPAAPANNEMALSDEQRAMLDQLRQAEQARKDEIAKIRAANCERSRGVLERLSTRGRIRVRNDDSGDERAMPDDERQRRIHEAQQGIVANCDPTS